MVSTSPLSDLHELTSDLHESRRFPPPALITGRAFVQGRLLGEDRLVVEAGRIFPDRYQEEIERLRESVVRQPVDLLGQ